MQPLFNLGLPCYRTFHPDTVASLSGLLLREHGRISQLIFRANMYIDKARNQIAKLSLDRPQVTHVLYLDDDMVFGPDLLERLVAHNLPVVGASYFQKLPPYNHTAGGLHPSGALAYRALQELPSGLAQVGSLGMGATLVQASLLRQMSQHFGDENWFRSDEGGEDIHFFSRCRKMSVPVHLDGSLIAGHVGEYVVTDAHWKAVREDRLDPEAPGGYRPHFEALYEAAVKRLPAGAVVVEVGSYLGRSAILMADLLLMAGKPFRLICVDHFRGSDDDPALNPDSARRHKEAVQRGGGSFRAEFEKNLHEARVRRFVEVFEGDSAECASRLEDGSVDFAFLDASHDEASVRKDILAWLPKIKQGGILAGDDYTWPGVKAAVTALLPGTYPFSPSQWWYDVAA